MTAPPSTPRRTAPSVAPRISVIIPAHDAEPYLGKAIESCLSQTRPPDEIVIADDVSKDGTARVAEAFGPPVRVLRLERNLGPAGARHEAILHATGDWLAFLDADDWYLPEKLERVAACAAAHPEAVLVYSGYRTSLDGVESAPRFPPPRTLWPALRYRCPLQISSVMLRTDAYHAIGGFDHRLKGVEDYDLWVRVALRYGTRAFAAIADPLMVYRLTPGSLSSSAIRMFEGRRSMLEGTLLAGTSGLSRRLWRRRILAFMYYDTAVSLREEGSPRAGEFLARSFASWPMPTSVVPLRRYKVLGAMIRQRLRGGRAGAPAPSSETGLGR